MILFGFVGFGLLIIIENGLLFIWLLDFLIVMKCFLVFCGVKEMFRVLFELRVKGRGFLGFLEGCLRFVFKRLLV